MPWCLRRRTEQVASVIKVAARHRIPVVPRGAGTGLSGGAVTIRGGIALQVTRMRAHRDRPRRPDGTGRAGRRQPGALARRRRARPLLRAGPIEPEGVHHRRQRRRELGRPSLPLLRGHHQPRARHGGRARGRQHPLGQRRRARPRRPRPVRRDGGLGRNAVRDHEGQGSPAAHRHQRSPLCSPHSRPSRRRAMPSPPSSRAASSLPRSR